MRVVWLMNLANFIILFLASNPESLLSDLCSTSCKVVILGDLNLDIDWFRAYASGPAARQSRFSRFLSLFSQLGLTQHVSMPTCGTSILDIILAAPDLCFDVSISPPLKASDHCIVNFVIKISFADLTGRSWRDFMTLMLKRLSQSLIILIGSRFSMAITLSMMSMKDLSWFCACLLKTLSQLRSLFPWSIHIHHILEISTIREKDYFALSRTPCLLVSISKLTKIFCFISSDTWRTNKKLSGSRNMKNLFSYISRRLGKKKSFRACMISMGGFLLPTKTNVFTNTSAYDNDSAVDPLVRHDCPLPFIDYSVVYKYLRVVESSSALPSDGIPSIFYKMFASKLARPLCHIFNISLIMGQVPGLWKESIVTAIPKKSSSSLPNEFRPISIMPTPCKIMEKILKSCFLDWLNLKTLLNCVVDRMSSWTSKWGLRLNFDKTCVLSLGNRPTDLSPADIPSSCILDQTRDLGVIISNSLSWDFHIDGIRSRALRCLYSLFRIVKTTDLTVLLKLYKTYVRPILEYCSQVWNPHSKKLTSQLEKVSDDLHKTSVLPGVSRPWISPINAALQYSTKRARPQNSQRIQ
ncbi:hypothetical protein OSTOST_05588 [Ostertagia ostertagi]